MELYNLLKNLDIKYGKIDHKPVYTVKEAKELKNMIAGIGCKNLFLTNKNGKYYLVILKDDKKADFNNLSQILQVNHLSFASELELENILGLKKGSVTPFGIINDSFNKVFLLIDKDLKDHVLLFHPNINTTTVSISFSDLEKFINYLNHKYIII